MQKTIKNKTYAFIDGFWTGVDKNGKVFKVTVKSLLEELNKLDDTVILKTEDIVSKEQFTPLVGEWVQEMVIEDVNRIEEGTNLSLDNLDKSEFEGILSFAKQDEIKAEFQTESQEEDVDLSGVKPTEKESKGLGDTIAKITSVLGIEPCESCNQRKEKLNKWFPYLKADVRDLTEQEKDMFDKATVQVGVVKGIYVKDVFKLYNDLFATKLQPCRCPGLLSKIVERIKVVRGED